MNDELYLILIFIMAMLLGYELIKKIPPTLHTPLMSGTNAISGIVIIGSILGYGIAWTVLTLWVILKMRELKRGKTWVWYESSPPVFKY